jgi:hypothetical protein
VAAEPLAAAIDSFTTPFSGALWLGEASSGALAIYDRREGILHRVPPGSTTLERLTTRGRGPLEVRGVHRIERGTADSLFVLDASVGKAVVLDTNARPVREERSPIASSTTLTGSGWVRAVSATGDWYASLRKIQFGSNFSVDDSATVVRWRRVDGRTDTLARIGMQPVRFGSATAPSQIELFDRFDAWGVFRDGRVIIVRAADYAVEIVDSDGRTAVTGRGPTSLLGLTRKDAEQATDSVLRQRAELLRNMPPNPMAAQAGVTPGSRPDPVLPDPLPAYWPLLRSDEILVDWQDRAWVWVRAAPHDATGSRYDLFDRDGRFLKAVQLALGERLVGFGRDAVFVSRLDGDGFVWLRRHPLP